MLAHAIALEDPVHGPLAILLQMPQEMISQLIAAVAVPAHAQALRLNQLIKLRGGHQLQLMACHAIVVSRY